MVWKHPNVGGLRTKSWVSRPGEASPASLIYWCAGDRFGKRDGLTTPPMPLSHQRNHFGHVPKMVSEVKLKPGGHWVGSPLIRTGRQATQKVGLIPARPLNLVYDSLGLPPDMSNIAGSKGKSS